MDKVTVHVLTQCIYATIYTDRLGDKKKLDCAEKQINQRVDYDDDSMMDATCETASGCQTQCPYQIILFQLVFKICMKGKIVKKIKLNKVNKLKFTHIIYNYTEIN